MMNTEAVCPREEEDRIEIKVLGTLIGTASGWDDVDVNHLQYYDFIPDPSFTPFQRESFSNSTCMSINLDTGLVETYGDKGEVIWSGNLRLAT